MRTHLLIWQVISLPRDCSLSRSELLQMRIKRRSLRSISTPRSIVSYVSELLVFRRLTLKSNTKQMRNTCIIIFHRKLDGNDVACISCCTHIDLRTFCRGYESSSHISHKQFFNKSGQRIGRIQRCEICI